MDDEEALRVKLRGIFRVTTRRLPGQAVSTYVSPDGRYLSRYTKDDMWEIYEYGVFLGIVKIA